MTTTKPETSEKALTKACVERLAAARRSGRRVWSFKVHGGPMQRGGVPDLCVIVEGRTLWIELKRGSGTVSKLQAATMTDMRWAGAEVFVVRTADEFAAVLWGEPSRVEVRTETGGTT